VWVAEKKHRLKALKDHAEFAALRDRVMIEVLLGTGIRLGEQAVLNIDDIDPGAKHLRIRAKGNECDPGQVHKDRPAHSAAPLPGRATVPWHTP
jgi:site-specific recombinase XerC